ncbi:MAG: amino acid ABC transporter permease [Jiangellaceae bacterium]
MSGQQLSDTPVRPRMSRRQRSRLVRGGMYALFVALVVLVVVATDWERLQRGFFNWDVAKELFPDVLTVAARNTVIYTLVSFALGLVGGLVLALMKLSSIGPYRWLATAYIEIFRGLPALLTIFLFAFGLPIALGINVPFEPVGPGLVGLSVVAAAYMAETIRAGIEAVPRGQLEAARSLGMGRGRAMASIVIPQALRIVIPPMTNELILIIKDTSLLFIAGQTPATKELLAFGRDIATNTFNVTPIVVVGAVYLIITIPMTQLVAVLERRNRAAR